MAIGSEGYIEKPLVVYDLANDNVIDLRTLFKPAPQKVIIIGVDVGQLKDYTAICVADMDVRLLKPADPLVGDYYPVFETHYLIKGIQRLELGTSYTKVANHITAIGRRLIDRENESSIHCLIDVTGVGRGVLDLLKDRIDSRVMLGGVTLTGGDASKGDDSVLYRTESHVSKTYVVSRLQAALQSGRIHLPKSPLMDSMVEELLNFEIRVRAKTGSLESGAFEVGTHDDLVIALGMCCLSDYQSVTYGQALSWYGSPV